MLYQGAEEPTLWLPAPSPRLGNESGGHPQTPAKGASPLCTPCVSAPSYALGPADHVRPILQLPTSYFLPPTSCLLLPAPAYTISKYRRRSQSDTDRRCFSTSHWRNATYCSTNSSPKQRRASSLCRKRSSASGSDPGSGVASFAL